MKIYTPEFAQALGEIYIEASQDPQFKERLLKDGSAVLKEWGVSVPEDFTVKFSEGTASAGLTIPLPVIEPLSDEALEGVAGGADAGDGDEVGSGAECWGPSASLWPCNPRSTGPRIPGC